MTNNKSRISLLYLIIMCISARIAPHMLSLKDEYLCFLNFLINHLGNSPADYWSSESKKELIPVPLCAVQFLAKRYKPLKKEFLDIYHISDLAISNTLPSNTLLEAVLLDKFLESL